MDVKDLNKTQLIMLALLLSFVTSIATGITTVTLMQQAPASVTVPINRVVRQTVEKIVQVPGNNTVQTIVIKEEDLVVDAIAKNRGASFSILKEVEDLSGNKIEMDAGYGFAVSKDGIVVADKSLVFSGFTYYVKNDSGKLKTELLSSVDTSSFSFLKIGAPIDETNKLSFTLPVFGDLSKLKIGQKIIMFGSSINSFIFEGNKDIKISNAKSNAGAMVLNLDGEILGMALSGETTSFVSIDAILESLKTPEATQGGEQTKTQ